MWGTEKGRCKCWSIYEAKRHTFSNHSNLKGPRDVTALTNSAINPLAPETHQMLRGNPNPTQRNTNFVSSYSEKQNGVGPVLILCFSNACPHSLGLDFNV